MNSYTLSSQLSCRPGDEHFATMADFMESAKQCKESSIEANIPNKDISFVGDRKDREDMIGIKIYDSVVAPTRFTTEKISTRLGLPISLVGRLSFTTYCQGLNELWSNHVGESKVLLQRKGDSNIIRDLTDISYARVWDNDYYAIIREFLPNGFAPAIPSINSDGNGRNIRGNNKPALFRGDRDSVCFWQTDSDNGGSSDFGGLRMGIMAWNSEVKSRSLGYQTFLFRGMCANFIIWDVAQQRTRRKYHRGQNVAFDRYFEELKKYLVELDTTLNPSTLDVFGKAAKTPFVGNGKATHENREKAAEKIKQFWTTVGKKDSIQIVEDSMLPQNAAQTGDPELSYLTIANGISWFAKDTNYSDSLEEGGKIAGSILQAASL